MSNTLTSNSGYVPAFSLDKVYPQSSTSQAQIRITEPIEIDHTLAYKYTYTDVISTYNVNLYELDEELEFILSPGSQSTPIYTTLTQNINAPITFNNNAKYLVLVCEKPSGSTSQDLTLEELKTKLDLIQLNTDKKINITEENYEFWDGNVLRKSNDKASNNNSMLLQKGSLSQEPEVPNGNYSISFYYQKLIELANASVVINENEYQLDSTEVKQFYTGEQDSETKEYIVQPITVTNGHIKIEFKCDTNNGVEVYDLMCNKGSVKLAYSQNQNETTTDTVNISKGITITSSVDENVKFKANYDGIRVLDGNNNVKTKFTDKGMETNEAKITEKAEITGLLFQEVDDQTWITKM